MTNPDGYVYDADGVHLPDAEVEETIEANVRTLRVAGRLQITVPGLPPDVADQVRDALVGDSNDAEHDALVSVAGAFGIEYAVPE